MKTLYIIDVSSLFFRAFYAIRQLNNSSGTPTNALYGFLAIIAKLLKEHKPGGIVFCYDSPGRGFREDIYEAYKANRDEAPADLVKQIPYLKKMGEALNVPGFEQTGYEADDLIGCLVKTCRRKGVEVVVVSSDKDFAQLVEPGVKMYDPAKEIFIDSAGVKAKWGVDPEQIIDYLSLVGDASDNVPGVKGIGPKGAVKLLTEFRTLEEIFKNLDLVKNERTRELLQQSKESAYLSKRLVTIHCDLDLNVDLESLRLRPVNRELLVPLLHELEFKALLQRLLGEEPPQKTETQKILSTDSSPQVSHFEVKPATEKAPVQANLKFSVSADIAELDRTFQKQRPKEIWLDVTSRGLGIQMGENVFRFEGDSEKFSNWINDILSAEPIALSGFDTKNIAHQLKLQPRFFKKVGQDVLLEAYCTGLGGTELSLEEMVKKYLEESMPEFAQPELRIDLVQRLSRELHKKLDPETINQILNKIEQPLAPVLYRIESHGVLINSSALNEFSKELSEESRSLEKEICELVGTEFNVGSPKQLAQILFDKLKLPVVRKTKTGFSTDSDVLEALKSKHPVAEKVLQWREITKLKSTYVDVLPRIADPNTGRVHTSFNQAVAATGRLSSTNPNLQNIPIRSPKGQRIREAFVAPEGASLVSADYSQVELRILAHVTGDKNLARAFEYDLDIHTATASEVFGVALSEVTSEQRRAAKAINFGIVYGMSDFGLAENLKIERRLAGEFIERYFARYPGVQKYMHEVVETGKRDGFVQTIFGRRRYYPELRSSNHRIRTNAERAAINMPIQGAAADIIKLAMIEVDRNLNRTGLSAAKMILQVHDELVFEVSKEGADELRVLAKEWMESTTKLSVPLKVDVGAGSSWGTT